jgi:hypothetical protein
MAEMSDNGFRCAADRGELPVIRTADGKRLFRVSDVKAFAANRAKGKPR